METETILWSKDVIILVILNLKLILAILRYTLQNNDKNILSADICNHLHSVLFVFNWQFVGHAMFRKHNFWSFKIGLSKLF
jgi:hypothetical protein